MKKQFYAQATAALSLVLAAHTGCTAAVSLGLTDHVNNVCSKSSRTHGKAQAAIKHSRIAKSAAAVLHGGVQHSAAAGASPGNFAPQQRRDWDEYMRKSSDSTDLSASGDAAAAQGKWPQAAALYQAALDIWPDNSECLYGLGQCAAAAGDLPRAVSYYRAAVYADQTKEPGQYGTVPGDGFQTNDVKRLMEFALLLNRAGQSREAVFIYNRAASLIDYERGDVQHGVPTVKVLLPELVTNRPAGNQASYTPDHLQALAKTALAYKEMSFGSSKEAIAHMQEAIKLYPDSPVTHYYLGEALPSGDPQEKTEYKKAAVLGDEQIVAAAKERMGMLR